MKSLRENLHAVLDVGTIISIAIVFAGMMVLGIVIWKINDQLTFPYGSLGTSTYMIWKNTSTNITGGFDNAINLILVAITIFILAVAISALLMLRGRQQ